MTAKARAVFDIDFKISNRFNHEFLGFKCNLRLFKYCFPMIKLSQH